MDDIYRTSLSSIHVATQIIHFQLRFSFFQKRLSIFSHLPGLVASRNARPTTYTVVMILFYSVFCHKNHLYNNYFQNVLNLLFPSYTFSSIFQNYPYIFQFVSYFICLFPLSAFSRPLPFFNQLLNLSAQLFFGNFELQSENF